MNHIAGPASLLALPKRQLIAVKVLLRVCHRFLDFIIAAVLVEQLNIVQLLAIGIDRISCIDPGHQLISGAAWGRTCLLIRWQARHVYIIDVNDAALRL